MSTETIVRAEDVHEGDKLTLTFNFSGAEHIITGSVQTRYDGALAVGGRSLRFVLDLGGKIERHAPEWRNARIVHVAGRTFYRRDADSAPWHELTARYGGSRFFSTPHIAALGTPRIIIDKDGNPA